MWLNEPEFTCLKNNIPLRIAATASRALLPPVMASQIPETEAMNGLLDSDSDGDRWLWVLAGVIPNKYELMWVLKENEDECTKGVQFKEGGMEMVDFRFLIIAMDG